MKAPKGYKTKGKVTEEAINLANESSSDSLYREEIYREEKAQKLIVVLKIEKEDNKKTNKIPIYAGIKEYYKAVLSEISYVQKFNKDYLLVSLSLE